MLLSCLCSLISVSSLYGRKQGILWGKGMGNIRVSGWRGRVQRQRGMFHHEDSDAGSEYPQLCRDQPGRHWPRNSDVAPICFLQEMFIACIPGDFLIIAKSTVRVLHSAPFKRRMTIGHIPILYPFFELVIVTAFGLLNHTSLNEPQN